MTSLIKMECSELVSSSPSPVMLLGVVAKHCILQRGKKLCMKNFFRQDMNEKSRDWHAIFRYSLIPSLALRPEWDVVVHRQDPFSAYVHKEAPIFFLRTCRLVAQCIQGPWACQSTAKKPNQECNPANHNELGVHLGRIRVWITEYTTCLN